MSDTQSIVYSDLDELRKEAKDLVENVKRKSELDIVKELEDAGIKVTKILTPDELLKQADDLENKAKEIKTEANKKLTQNAVLPQIDLLTLRKYAQKLDENSDTMKKVRENEALIFKR
jgi:hypothetical protein